MVAWVAHALTTRSRRRLHANIFYPHRNALAFSEANLVAGAIGAPVWAATHNPYTTHNAAALVSFVIAFAGAYYLTRYLTGSRGGAVVAAVLFAFCPFIFARTAHIQLLLHRRHPVLPARVSPPRRSADASAARSCSGCSSGCRRSPAPITASSPG